MAPSSRNAASWWCGSISGSATPLELELIHALAQRYDSSPAAPRPALDSAYAAAMSGVAERHGTDPDVLTLFGAALMNLSPWNYWEGDYGRHAPRSGTGTAARQGAPICGLRRVAERSGGTS